jgi:zinc protease
MEFSRTKAAMTLAFGIPILTLYLLSSPFQIVCADTTQFPDYELESFDNGLKVIVHEDHELPVVYLEVMIRAGSAFDQAGKEGLANFTAETITEGTVSRSSTDIAESIDFVGGSISASSGYDATYISCTVLKKDFDLGLEILSDIILNPAFPEEEVERQRSQIITSIIGNMDQKSTIANNNFQDVLFGDHAYSHPVIGLKASIDTITRDDIIQFYDSYYRPNNSVIAVAGDVDRAEVFGSLKEALGGWKSAFILEDSHREVVDPVGYRIRLVNKPDVTQSEIRIGYLGITRKDPRYFPLLLMNYNLGGGVFSGRLMQVIRSEMGLTYGISSTLGARVQRGSFSISTFTRTETTLKAIQAILNEVEKMKDGGITTKELEDAKARYIGGFPLGIETPSQVAGKILTVELYELGRDYLSNYTSSIGKVSLEEVNTVASEFLRSKDLVIVVVGNAELLRDDLKKLGEVEEIFYTDTEADADPPHEYGN